MSQAVAVSVEITPEASALADELGFRSQLDSMLAKAPEFFPDLVAIGVSRLEAFPETHEHAAICLAFHRPGADPEDVSPMWAYRRWRGEMFPPEVGERFTQRTIFRAPTDAR